MSSSEHFTILLPTYNRPEQTRKALKSCLDQTYPHYSVWVLDDARTDEIRKIVESFDSKKVTYIHNDPPLGMPRKLNAVLERVPGRWAVILGDDDWFEPAYLERMARLIGEYPDAPLIRVRYRLIDPFGEFFRLDHLENKELSPAESLAGYFRRWYKICINLTGVLFRVDWLREAGAFPEGYHQAFHVDQMAWSRLCMRGTAIFDPEPLVNLSVLVPSALSQKFARDHEAFLDTKDKAFEDAMELQRKLAASARTSRERNAAREAGKNIRSYFRDLSNHFMESLLLDLLASNDANASGEFRKAYERFSKVRFGMGWYFRLYYFLQRLPMPLRGPGRLLLVRIPRGIHFRLFSAEILKYYPVRLLRS